MVGAWQALAFLLTELGAGQPWGDLLSDLVPVSRQWCLAVAMAYLGTLCHQTAEVCIHYS